MKTKPPLENKLLKKTILEKINSEQVCPRPRFFFFCQECFVWLLWFLAVLTGSLAVAVSLFVVTHSQYALYEATHENFLTFMVEVLPYIWLVVFGATVYLAIYNLRHTKKGYNYPLTVIIIGGVLLSLAGGSVLQLFGLGYEIDDMLGQNMPVYQSQSKLEQTMWQRPYEGRLLGAQTSSTVPTSTAAIIFQDVTGKEWKISTNELRPRDLALLASGKTVRLLGECIDKEQKIFHVCGVFPWMVESGVTVQDMSRERKAFIEGVNNYVDKQITRQEMISGTTTFAILPESICEKVMPIRRMLRY